MICLTTFIVLTQHILSDKQFVLFGCFMSTTLKNGSKCYKKAIMNWVCCLAASSRCIIYYLQLKTSFCDTLAISAPELQSSVEQRDYKSFSYRKPNTFTLKYFTIKDRRPGLIGQDDNNRGDVRYSLWRKTSQRSQRKIKLLMTISVDKKFAPSVLSLT